MIATGGFMLADRTVRIFCELEDKVTGEKPYDGLWADVRRNLTNGEQAQFKEAAKAIDDRADEIEAERKALNERFTAAMDEVGENPEVRINLIRDQIDAQNRISDMNALITVDRFTLLAPHIHGWNLQTMNDAGEIEPVPPPREAGAAALAHITPEIVGWLLAATLQAYRVGFPIGSRTSGARQEPTPEPSADEPKEKTPSSRRSRKTSSSPSPSTFEA